MFNYGLSHSLDVFCLAHPVCLFDNERSLRVQRNDEFTGSCGFSELVRGFLIIRDKDQQVCSLNKISVVLVWCVYVCVCYPFHMVVPFYSV